MSETPQSKEKYLRVSTVLSPFSGLKDIPADIVEHAASRGTKVHLICQGIVSGFGEFGVDEETRPYIESFKEWWNPGMQFMAIERRFWDDENQITGQCDYILQTPNGLAIVDLKTSYRPSKTWQVQGQGYYWLAKRAGINIEHIWFIHLQRTGKPPKIYDYAIDDSLWCSTLNVYKHFYHKIKNE